MFIRKGAHTTTPDPSLAKEGSLLRARNPEKQVRLNLAMLRKKINFFAIFAPLREKNELAGMAPR